ncbi:hypothetical protein ACR9WD_06450 [Glutamicibacter sp. PAEs-4]|uniref:hypothetical protein n=1 Tax=Glutamicibacter sp. PAEs-4 TaxID=3444114 RepID=UPI003EBD91AD
MSASWSEKHPLSHIRATTAERVSTDPSLSAFWILRIGFVVLPLLMGLDKFANMMTYWPDYLAPWVIAILPFSAQTAMHVVGVVELVAAASMIIKPRYASYVLALWLLGIIINLVSMGIFLDVALRDVGLLVAALALTRLASKYDKPWGAKLGTR